jgi:hypothetical protein
MTTDSEFPWELRERLWHTTTPSRYDGILSAGSILPNPAIPDSERWKTSRGSDFYPYVRVLGGVSLFDFRAFDPDAYSAEYPLSSWREFVPYQRRWGAAIWIEIDRTRVGDAYIDGEALLARWKRENAQRHTIMPLIEAAHIGPIPLQAVSRVLQIGVNDPTFVEVSIRSGRRTETLRAPYADEA